MTLCYRQWVRAVSISGLVLSFALLLFPLATHAQTTSPESINLGADSPVCTGGSIDENVSITLPPETTTDKVDVVLLLDDTGSFAFQGPIVADAFESLIGSLESSFPDVEFGFGVARFEDYGGPGSTFGGFSAVERPFILSQPVITAADAGGTAARNTLIEDALDRTPPGGGGDGPESAIAEGLFQVATGGGFDGNGDGDTIDSGNAGDTATQTSPGTSGDVPAFATNTLPASGSLGGVGWRNDAQKIVIVATDICSIAAFDSDDGVPSTISGAGGSSVTTTMLTCVDTPGAFRFGFVSDAKSASDNTVTNAVVPSEAGTVPQTVSALNALGIQVVGIGGGGGSLGPNDFLAGMATLTGGLDSDGNPIVEPVGGDIAGAIEDVIETTATSEVEIALTASDLPDGLSFTPSANVPNVGPGETANFTAALEGDGTAISGTFDLQFRNAASNAILATIPVTVECEAAACDIPSLAGDDVDEVNRQVSNIILDDDGIVEFEFTTLDNFTVISTFPSGFEKDPTQPKWTWTSADDPPTSVPFTLAAGPTGVATYFIFMKDACPDGAKTNETDPVFDLRPVDVQFRLAGNYPNPFTEQTSIEYAVPGQTNVTLTVYDVMGRRVATLVDGPKPGGTYTASWNGRSDNGRDLASGVYLIHLQAGNQTTTHRMSLVR